MRKEVSVANTAFRSKVNWYVRRALKSGFIIISSSSQAMLTEKLLSAVGALMHYKSSVLAAQSTATVAFKTISCECVPPVASCLIFLETILFDSGNAFMDYWSPRLSVHCIFLPSLGVDVHILHVSFQYIIEAQFLSTAFSPSRAEFSIKQIWGFCFQTYDTYDRHNAAVMKWWLSPH